MESLKLIVCGADKSDEGDTHNGAPLSSYQLCRSDGKVVAEVKRETPMHIAEVIDSLPLVLEEKASGCYVSLEVEKRSSLTPDHIKLLSDIVDAYNWEYLGAI